MPLDNDTVAEALYRLSDLLTAQRANAYRIRAYRSAAQAVRDLPEPISEIYAREGHKGLVALRHIGQSIASSVEELIHAGRLRILDRLEGEVSPEDLFTTVPGIGEELAHRIHDELHIETLEQLEQAAHDGSLARVPGFGPRRLRAIEEELASILSRSARRRSRLSPHEHPESESPDVATLLEVDAQYRAAAEVGSLRHITPRRFNPKEEAWLPVLHTDAGDFHMTAMFSNTANAHRLGRTRDWVVLYFAKDGFENQCTVVTEYQGALSGRRVVRGREQECVEHYRSL